MEVLCILLLCVCYFDYKYHKIPNKILLLMMIEGLRMSFIAQGWTGIFTFLLSLVVMVFVMYPLFRMGALGAGDVKLFGVCSAYLPYDRVVSFLFFSLLIAAIISLFILVRQQNRKEYLRSAIPMAGPIFAGVLLYMGGVY